jgi:hypothetical protein
MLDLNVCTPARRRRLELVNLWPLATKTPLSVLCIATAGDARHFLKHLVCVAGESGEVLNPEWAAGWTEAHLRQRPLTAQQRRVQENRVYPRTSGLWASWAEPTRPLSAQWHF